MNARELTCERCAAPFGCRADDPAGCWCRDVALSGHLLVALQQRFGDCLCGACLREFADDKKAGAGRPRPA